MPDERYAAGDTLWLWWLGRATPGEITYVLTTYFVVHGYLRDIGQHVHHLQRSVNDMEEMVQLHAEPMAEPSDIVAYRPGSFDDPRH